MNELPESIRGKVGQIELYGLRSHKFKVHVQPPAAVEVSLIFKEKLKNDVTMHGGKELWTTTEREPAEQKRFASAGRARAFLEMKVKAMEAEATVKCSWKPDYKFTANLAGGGAQLGLVEADGTITWNAEVLQTTFGMPVEQMQQELAAFRQQ